MRQIAIISDVHAQVAALQAVLGDIEGLGISEVWCLGDTIDVLDEEGVACMGLVDGACQVVLRGNHEQEWSGHTPRVQRMAIKHIDLDGRVGAWHGSPVDPLNHYVYEAEHAARALVAAREQYPSIELVLVGHAHVASAFTARLPLYDVNGPAPAGTHLPVFEPMVVCPGSVGGAFGEDGVARWAILTADDDQLDIEFRATKWREPLEPHDITIQVWPRP